MASIENVKKEEAKEVTLDTIEKEDILQMARYIQQLEQLTKDQRGYIIQLQTQLTNIGKKIRDGQKQQGNIHTFVTQEGGLDL